MPNQISIVVHSLLQNLATAGQRQLHLPGYSVADYPTLLTIANALPGDLCYQQDTGAYWKFDGNLNVFRILDKFHSTQSEYGSLQGMQPGDFLFLDDTQELAYWSGFAWSFIS